MQAHAYQPVDADALKELRGIVGERFVLTDDESVETYSRDETKGLAEIPRCEVVVKPATAEEIAAIVKLANRRRIPVTPRGAGSGLTGGALPVCGGISLSLERMNRILEMDADNMMVVVEPGVVTNEINEKLKELGLFYAGYPMSLETCYIGGNVAENAGGGRAVKYGVTERYVIGVQVVTPTGEIAEFGGKRVKDVTGYSIVKLMVGSEGTLGIVTRVTLKLLPLPKASVALLALFADADSAISVVPKIIAEGGVIPSAAEFMDRMSVRVACEYLNERIPYEQAGAMLLLEVDGSDEETVVKEYDTVGELCMKYGAQEVYVADNTTTRARLWGVRQNVAEAIAAMTDCQSSEDIVVPPAAIPQVIREFARLSEEYGMVIPCYGHAGDGNIHARILKKDEEPEAGWRARLPQITRAVYEVAKKLGGTISGEHGIGSKRKDYMGMVASEAELDFMRRIKRAVDPNGIMNPGKLIDA